MRKISDRHIAIALEHFLPVCQVEASPYLFDGLERTHEFSARVNGLSLSI